MFDTLKLIYTQDEALELVGRYEKVYKEKIKELEEENKSLKNELMEDMKTETELNERIRFLEQCLDNKEKVNISMREELKELNKMMLFETKI